MTPFIGSRPARRIHCPNANTQPPWEIMNRHPFRGDSGLPPRAPVDFAEVALKMKGALEVLREFDRPVALAVVGATRFNLDDFHDYGVQRRRKLRQGRVSSGFLLER